MPAAVGAPGQRSLDATDLLIGPERQPRTVTPLVELEQGVLEKRQLPRRAFDVVEDLLDQTVFEDQPHQPGRTCDRALLLLAAHRPDLFEVVVDEDVEIGR